MALEGEYDLREALALHAKRTILHRPSYHTRDFCVSLVQLVGDLQKLEHIFVPEHKVDFYVSAIVQQNEAVLQEWEKPNGAPEGDGTDGSNPSSPTAGRSPTHEFSLDAVEGVISGLNSGERRLTVLTDIAPPGENQHMKTMSDSNFTPSGTMGVGGETTLSTQDLQGTRTKGKHQRPTSRLTSAVFVLKVLKYLRESFLISFDVPTEWQFDPLLDVDQVETDSATCRKLQVERWEASVLETFRKAAPVAYDFQLYFYGSLEVLQFCLLDLWRNAVQTHEMKRRGKGHGSQSHVRPRVVKRFSKPETAMGANPTTRLQNFKKKATAIVQAQRQKQAALVDRSNRNVLSWGSFVLFLAECTQPSMDPHLVAQQRIFLAPVSYNYEQAARLKHLLWWEEKNYVVGIAVNNTTGVQKVRIFDARKFTLIRSFDVDNRFGSIVHAIPMPHHNAIICTFFGGLRVFDADQWICKAVFSVTSTIKTIRYLPNLKWIVVGTSAGEVIEFQTDHVDRWYFNNGHKPFTTPEYRIRKAHREPVNDILPETPTNCIVTSSMDGTIVYCHTESRSVRVLQGAVAFKMLLSVPLGLLFTYGVEPVPYIWISGVPSARPMTLGTKSNGHTDRIADIALLKDPVFGVSIDRIGGVKVWDLQKLCCIQTFHIAENHPNPQFLIFESFFYNPKFGKLFTVAKKSVFLVQFNDEEERKKTLAASTEAVTSVAYLPSRRIFFTSSRNGITVWNAVLGKEIDTIENVCPADDSITELIASERTLILYAGTHKGYLLEISLATLKVVAKHRPPSLDRQRRKGRRSPSPPVLGVKPPEALTPTHGDALQSMASAAGLKAMNTMYRGAKGPNKRPPNGEGHSSGEEASAGPLTPTGLSQGDVDTEEDEEDNPKLHFIETRNITFVEELNSLVMTMGHLAMTLTPDGDLRPLRLGGYPKVRCLTYMHDFHLLLVVEEARAGITLWHLPVPGSIRWQRVGIESCETIEDDDPLVGVHPIKIPEDSIEFGGRDALDGELLRAFFIAWDSSGRIYLYRIDRALRQSHPHEDMGVSIRRQTVGPSQPDPTAMDADVGIGIKAAMPVRTALVANWVHRKHRTAFAGNFSHVAQCGCLLYLGNDAGYVSVYSLAHLFYPERFNEDGGTTSSPLGTRTAGKALVKQVESFKRHISFGEFILPEHVRTRRSTTAMPGSDTTANEGGSPSAADAALSDGSEDSLREGMTSPSDEDDSGDGDEPADVLRPRDSQRRNTETTGPLPGEALKAAYPQLEFLPPTAEKREEAGWGPLKIWLLQSWRAHQDSITYLGTPTGSDPQCLVSASRDGYATVWSQRGTLFGHLSLGWKEQSALSLWAGLSVSETNDVALPFGNNGLDRMPLEGEDFTRAAGTASSPNGASCRISPLSSPVSPLLSPIDSKLTPAVSPRKTLGVPGVKTNRRDAVLPKDTTSKYESQMKEPIVPSLVSDVFLKENMTMANFRSENSTANVGDGGGAMTASTPKAFLTQSPGVGFSRGIDDIRESGFQVEEEIDFVANRKKPKRQLVENLSKERVVVMYRDWLLNEEGMLALKAESRGVMRLHERQRDLQHLMNQSIHGVVQRILDQQFEEEMRKHRLKEGGSGSVGVSKPVSHDEPIESATVDSFGNGKPDLKHGKSGVDTAEPSTGPSSVPALPYLPSLCTVTSVDKLMAGLHRVEGQLTGGGRGSPTRSLYFPPSFAGRLVAEEEHWNRMKARHEYRQYVHDRSKMTNDALEKEKETLLGMPKDDYLHKMNRLSLRAEVDREQTSPLYLQIHDRRTLWRRPEDAPGPIVHARHAGGPKTKEKVPKYELLPSPRLDPQNQGRKSSAIDGTVPPTEAVVDSVASRSIRRASSPPPHRLPLAVTLPIHPRPSGRNSPPPPVEDEGDRPGQHSQLRAQTSMDRYGVADIGASSRLNNSHGGSNPTPLPAHHVAPLGKQANPSLNSPSTASISSSTASKSKPQSVSSLLQRRYTQGATTSVASRVIRGKGGN